MTKSLQLDGEFWLPDDPDTKVPGVITSSPSDGTTLSLIGSFTDIMDKLHQRQSPDYRRIVGETVRGYLTLDDCHLTFENPFQQRQRFVVSRLLVNFAYDRDEPVKLDRLTVRLSDFARWLIEGAPSMFPDPAVLAKGEIPVAALAAKETENIQLGSNAQLDLVHTLPMTLGLGSMLLWQDSRAEFKFDNPVDLDSALDHAVDLLAAITFAADRVVEFEKVGFSHPALRQQLNSDHKSVDLHAQWNAQANPNRKDLISDRMAFTYAQLGGVVGLARLLAVIQQNRGYVRQVLRTRHGTEPNVQDVFFTRVSALEGFDKNLHPANASLKDRLRRLANNVATPFEALIGKGLIDRWCDRMVKLRNNIGHGDPIPLHQNAAELFQMSETAYWSFILNLLTRTRAPQAVFDHLTTVCLRFRWSARQVRGCY